MTSTIITHDELLKRGWRKRESRGVQVVSSAVSYKNDLAPHATVDCYGYFSLIAEIAGKITQIKVNTIEQLYSHLRHFGLIEPEPITAEGLLVMGFIRKPMHDKDAGLYNYELGGIVVLLNMGDNDLIDVTFKGESMRVFDMQDLRDLFRLMGGD